MSQFTGRHYIGGLTEYKSRRTGRRYIIVPDSEDGGDGYTVRSQGLNLFAKRRSDAMLLIELADTSG